MKNTHFLLALFLFICLELIFWGIFSGTSIYFYIGAVNLILVMIVYGELIGTILFSREGSGLKAVYRIIEEYGVTICVIGLLRFLIKFSFFGGAVNELITVLLVFVTCSSLTNWSYISNGFSFGRKKVGLSVFAFILSIFFVFILIISKRYSNHSILYAFAIMGGFILFSLGLYIEGNIDGTGDSIHKNPLWLLYAFVLISSFVRAFITIGLTRIEDHTIEKVIYEDTVIYIPIDEESTRFDDSGKCDIGYCINTDYFCIEQPVNSSCNSLLKQGRECLTGFKQVRDTCIKNILGPTETTDN